MVEVKLHDIGEGMTEGEILHYFVKVGDKVESDQPLVEVQTDKMSAELPSPTTGVVKEILVEAGRNVAVGTSLLVIETTVNSMPKESPENPERVVDSKRIILAAPYTRKIARELGINIEDISGTGPAGRITDDDIYRYVSKGNQPIVEKSPEAVLIAENKIETKQTVKDITEEIPFRGRRKQIAAKMSQSLYTIPHVTHFEEVDMTNLLEITYDLKENGEHLSVAAFFIKAIQLSLKQFPIFNSVLDEKKEIIQLKKEYNIGVAVDTEEGLIVPVVKNVELKTLKEVHAEMKNCVEKAQNNKLTNNDISGGTFTISNVGPLGGIGATPIINYPQTALVSFHKTKKRPMVVNDEIAIRSMMNISMSFDHRVADGATAVMFTNHFVHLLEHPTRMLLELK